MTTPTFSFWITSRAASGELIASAGMPWTSKSVESAVRIPWLSSTMRTLALSPITFRNYLSLASEALLLDYGSFQQEKRAAFIQVDLAGWSHRSAHLSGNFLP